MDREAMIRKATVELVALLVDGDKRLDRYRRTGRHVQLGSIALAFVAVAIAVFPPDAIAITSALLGIAGGVLIGINLMYESSVLTWPIVRPLLDEQAVQRFIREHQGATTDAPQAGG